MDKESIIGDAISYVLDLKKKVQEIKGEIDGLCSSKKGQDDQIAPEMIKKGQIAPEMIKPLTCKVNYASEKRFTESGDAKNSVDKLVNGKVFKVSTSSQMSFQLLVC